MTREQKIALAQVGTIAVVTIAIQVVAKYKMGAILREAFTPIVDIVSE